MRIVTMPASRKRHLLIAFGVTALIAFLVPARPSVAKEGHHVNEEITPHHVNEEVHPTPPAPKDPPGGFGGGSPFPPNIPPGHGGSGGGTGGGSGDPIPLHGPRVRVGGGVVAPPYWLSPFQTVRDFRRILDWLTGTGFSQ
jgi:hypothetical protein